MLNNYDALYEMIDGAPVKIPGRTTMFISYKSIRSDGTFETFESGEAVRTDLGLTFIVDSHIPEQFEKLYIDNEGFLPKLKVREGEVLENNASELEIAIKEKEQELLQLRAQYTEEVKPVEVV